MLKRRRPARIVGSIDGIEDVSIHGWAMDQNAPDDILEVAIVSDGRRIGQGRADQFRPDLLAAGFGHGKHGFKVPATDLSRPLISLSIVAATVGATRDGVALPLDPELSNRIAGALMRRGGPAELPDLVDDVFRQVNAGTFDGAGRDPTPQEKIYLADELFVGALLTHAARGPSGSPST